MPGPESILYPEFAIPPKKKISRVGRAPHTSHSGACKGKEVASMRRIILLAVLAAVVIAATAPLGWSRERLPLQADEATRGVCTAQAHGGNAPDPGTEEACAPRE